MTYCKGENDAAEKITRIWVKVAPNNPAAWTLLGRMNQVQDRVHEATACFKKALELDPNMVMALTWMAKLVPPSEGLPMLLRAAELDPRSDRAHAGIAEIYCKTFIALLGNF